MFFFKQLFGIKKVESDQPTPIPPANGPLANTAPVAGAQPPKEPNPPAVPPQEEKPRGIPLKDMKKSKQTEMKKSCPNMDRVTPKGQAPPSSNSSDTGSLEKDKTKAKKKGSGGAAEEELTEFENCNAPRRPARSRSSSSGGRTKMKFPGYDGDFGKEKPDGKEEEHKPKTPSDEKVEEPPVGKTQDKTEATNGTMDEGDRYQDKKPEKVEEK